MEEAPQMENILYSWSLQDGSVDVTHVFSQKTGKIL